MLPEIVFGAGRAEAGHADETAAFADVTVPAEARGGLRGYAHGARPENGAAIGLVLSLEEFPARHRDDSCRHALPLQRFARSHRQGYFGAGCKNGCAAWAVRLGQDIGAVPGRVLVAGMRAHRLQRLAREDQSGRAGAIGESDLPALRRSEEHT